MRNRKAKLSSSATLSISDVLRETRYLASQLEVKDPVYFMEYSRCELHSRNSLNSHSITGPALLGRVESSGVLKHRAKVGHHEAGAHGISDVTSSIARLQPFPNDRSALCTKVPYARDRIYLHGKPPRNIVVETLHMTE